MLTGRPEGCGARERTASIPVPPAGGLQVWTGHIGNLTDPKVSHKGAKPWRMAGANFNTNLLGQRRLSGGFIKSGDKKEQGGTQPATAMEWWFAPYFIQWLRGK